jgi:hypothetical protein
MLFGFESNVKVFFSKQQTEPDFSSVPAHLLYHNFFNYVQCTNGGPLMVEQWLRYCVTNRKVAGSIPDGDIGIFH